MEHRAWFRFGLDPASLGTTIFRLLCVAVAIGIVGFVFLPGLYGITSVVLWVLFIGIFALCVLLVISIIRAIVSR